MRSKLGLLLSAGTLAACCLGSLPARAVTRCAVMAHAQAWVDAGVMYSQGPWGGYCPGDLYCDPNAGGECYRPDCSGFVSAVWGLPAPGNTTYKFAGGPWDDGSSYAITMAELAPGDALNFGGDPNAGSGHIMLFGGWIDANTMWILQENLCGTPANYQERTLDSLGGYLPIRYTGIEECAPSSHTEHDVNGDGRADLVSAGGDGTAYVWPGQAGGDFGGAVGSFGGTLDSANIDGSGHFIVGVSDVTGDGKADLVSASTDGSAYVWPGKASGEFGVAVSSFGGTLDLANIDGGGHYIVGVADVTGDGKSDLISVNTGGSAFVWPGQASGGFGDAVASLGGAVDLANLDGTGQYIVGVADVTGDGMSDLVGVGVDGSAYVWPGQATGEFGAAVSSFGGTLDFANFVVDVADVTGDGMSDLVSVNEDGSAYVWPGQATGEFGAAASSFAGMMDSANLDGTGHYIVGLEDVTGDGKSDLVGVDADGSAYVWPGDASGAFGGAVKVFGGTMDFANQDGTGHYIVAPLGPHVTSWPRSSGAEGDASTGTGTARTPGGDAEADADADADPAVMNDGCACRAATGSPPSPWALGLVAALTWIAAGRRRRSGRAA